MLVEAGDLLAPKHFKPALDGSPPIQSASGQSEAIPDRRVSVVETGDLDALDHNILDALLEKGGKLKQHKVVLEHAQKHLLEVGTVDANKRYVDPFP